MSLANIANSINYLQFFENKYGIKPVNTSDFVILFKKCKQFIPSNLTLFDRLPRYVINENIYLNNLIYDTYSICCPPLIKILNKTKGKLSIGGTSILNVLNNETTVISNIDIYFHSCTKLECQRILLNAIKTISNKISNFYKIRQVNNIIIINYGMVSIYFICITFESKSNMLKYINETRNQHGWDPINGYFGTLSAAMSYCYSIELINRNSTIDDVYQSAEHRLTPIINIKQTGPNTYPIDNLLIYNFDGKVALVLPPKPRYPLNIKLTSEQFRDLVINNIKFSVVGINNDRYVAFMNCRRKFNIHDDMFKLLCYYWLLAEVTTIRNNILS